MNMRLIFFLFIITILTINPVTAQSLNVIGEGGNQDNAILQYSITDWDKLINGYDYHKQNRQYVNKYSTDISKDDAFRFEYKGTYITFSPKSVFLSTDKINIKSASYKKSDISSSKLNYNELIENSTYTLNDIGNIVKEELILYSNPFPTTAGILEFKHAFDSSGLDIYINGLLWDRKTEITTSNRVVFKKDGIEYFAFSAPVAYDINNNKITLSYTFSKNSIVLNTPMSFLNSAVYPVTIDPSLEQNGGSITLDGTHNYDYVNLTNGAVLYITAYDGTGTKGWLQLNVTYDVNIDATSSINGNSRGYTGGVATNPASCNVANEGGRAGTGTGAGARPVPATNGQCGGMGGAGAASYGSTGGAGGNPGHTGVGGVGGTTGSVYGTTTGWDIDIGSGSGGGGTAGNAGTGQAGNPGGAKLIINAHNINNRGTITMNGGQGGTGGYAGGYYGGGGGGGASGGGILLNTSNTTDISSSTVIANGGAGGGHGGSVGSTDGSSGGGGRIKIFYGGLLLNTSTSISAGTIYYSFTDLPPTIPILNAHADYAVEGVTNTTWSASTSPNGNPITYNVKVGTTSGGTDVLSYTGDTDTTSNNFNIYIPRTYYWSVQACDNFGACSAWSTEDSFGFSGTIPLQLVYPANNSAYTGNYLKLNWTEWPINSLYNYQISNTSDFSSVFSQGSECTILYGNISTCYLTLDLSKQYYWRVKNATGSYTNYFTFSTSATPQQPGSINIQVKDEQTQAQISNFTVNLYNSSYVFNKTATFGWTNFSSSDILAGYYFAHIIPNSSYASRSQLIYSPANITFYIPSTNSTINTVQFYILDYSGLYPWDTSIFSVIKNGSVMHSSYFDADAKVGVNLINGDSYVLQVTNGNNVYQWNNYVPITSGSINLVILNTGYNATSHNPFNYNVTWSNDSIIASWMDFGTLISPGINFTIYKGTGKILVHNRNTTESSGSSEYLITNHSDVYYVVFTATTTNGNIQKAFTIDYRAGQVRGGGLNASGEAIGYDWNYGTFVMPEWVYNAVAWLLLLLLAGSAGYLHSGFMGIVTGVFAILFWYWKWLDIGTLGPGLLGGVVLIIIISYFKEKEHTS